MKSTLKKIATIIIVIIFLILMTCEPKDPKGDLTPYMSDVVEIPQRVKAKGKANKSIIKTLKGYESLGTYTLTAYCNCAKCCGSYAGGKTASGTTPKAGRTIAVDPKIIPYGTEIYINHHKYIAEDCGGAIKGNHIDIYFNNHSECLEFGKQEAEVYKRKKKKLLTRIKTKGEIMTWQRNIFGLSLKRTFSRPEQ